MVGHVDHDGWAYGASWAAVTYPFSSGCGSRRATDLVRRRRWVRHRVLRQVSQGGRLLGHTGCDRGCSEAGGRGGHLWGTEQGAVCASDGEGSAPDSEEVRDRCSKGAAPFLRGEKGWGGCLTSRGSL